MLKSSAEAYREADLLSCPAGGTDIIGRSAVLAQVRDANVGRELSRDLVAKPQPCIEFRQPGPDPARRVVFGIEIGLVRARRLSEATMSNIRQNLFFAFWYNAAGVLYPWFGILLSPIIAAVAMALSSVSVIAKSLRLRRVRL